MIMSIFLFSVAFGNFFTARVNDFIQIPDVGLTTEAHAGFDGKIGTDDDLRSNEEAGTIESPALTQLQQAFTAIQSLAEANGKALPLQEDGQAAINGIRDPWGNPVRYALLNSTTARISSDGPDKTPKTKWDLGAMITFSAAGDDEDPGSWLAKRKRELGITKESPDNPEDATLLSAAYYAGGQTKLEGSSYFWFFTWLMLGTAIVFVPYAILYKGETILQD
jgi:POT family proton-dependent oligopeptide transporter